MSYAKWVTVAASLAVTAGVISTAPSKASEKPPVEKCYGIAKKGMNQCADLLHKHTCEAMSPVDGDPNEWIFVLQGTCHKIVGGVKR